MCNLCGFVGTSQEIIIAHIGAHHETKQLVTNPIMKQFSRTTYKCMNVEIPTQLLVTHITNATTSSFLNNLISVGYKLYLNNLI